ncbi:cupin domain-containing protein [Blastococcus deserti]|uniref:Cupin domain-containing protein n=1 Tax=Blastococcus deserti TaxID=2259033 RepID=A0ABW4XI27_9ACTN
MTAQLLTPFARTPAADNSVWYMGHLFSFLADAADTRGQFSAMEILVRRGGEPPMHVHHAEDEAFYVLGGRFTFHVGDQVLPAPTGTLAFLPKDVPHGFVCHEETGRLLCLHAPGGAEQEFRDMGSPATAMTLGPMPQEEPDPGLMERMAARYHYEIVGPPPGATGRPE